MGRPGDYVPDTSEGITRVEDLPPPHVEQRSRDFRRRKCPRCGRSAPRCNQGQRTLHDLGNVRTGRPIDIVIAYSKHRCPDCRRCFNADMADLALPKCHYTHRVQQTAVRLVVEDGLPYRSASWHLWRDHRVFVPWATIQNWVEAGGEKGGRSDRGRLPRPRPGGLQRLHRRR
jgi:hypothetical protein